MPPRYRRHCHRSPPIPPIAANRACAPARRFQPSQADVDKVAQQYQAAHSGGLYDRDREVLAMLHSAPPASGAASAAASVAAVAADGFDRAASSHAGATPPPPDDEASVRQRMAQQSLGSSTLDRSSVGVASSSVADEGDHADVEDISLQPISEYP